jgi:hypothetical protein
MAKEKKFVQSAVFEFDPKDNITTEEVMELKEFIRIGVSGDTLSNASENLKRHFKEIKGN